MFYPFPWIYRADSYSMDSLEVMQAVDADIPSEYPNGDEWLEETLESAPPGSITLMLFKIPPAQTPSAHKIHVLST